MPRWLWLTLGGIGAAGTGAAVAHLVFKPDLGLDGDDDARPRLLVALARPVTDPARDYELIIAQRYDSVFASCESRFGTLQDVLRCAAAALFPNQTWPPPPEGRPWQHAAWRVMGDLARQQLGLPPLPVG